jgi:hypothetical protein
VVVALGGLMEWASAECTLPTEERPVRLAEFDTLLASALRRLERVRPTHLRLVLDGDTEVEHAVRDLAGREAACCSFFTFTFSRGGDELVLDVEVPGVRTALLDRLAARAAAAASAGES